MRGSSPMPCRLPGMGEDMDSEAAHVAPVEQAVNREMLAIPLEVSIHYKPMQSTQWEHHPLGDVPHQIRGEHQLELWKIHKYCKSASLSELRERRARLKALIETGKVAETNAAKALALISEYIELKSLFEE